MKKQINYYLSTETVMQIKAISELRDMKHNAVVALAVRELYNRLFHGPSTVTIEQAEKATSNEQL